MSEQEPAFSRKVSSDERDEVAKLEQQLKRATFQRDQKEAFGKFDVTAPNESEDTYQSYLEQRPADGVVRDGDSFRNNGQFASEGAYEAQKVDTQDYYDQKGGLINAGEYEIPNYEAMGVMQLAKEAAKARELGDSAEEKTIREALEHHLTMDAMKDDSETPKAAQARYDSEIAQYEELVNKFTARSQDEVVPQASETSVEGATSEAPEADGEQAAVSEAVEQTTTPEAPAEEEAVTLNGEKVTLGNVFVSPDGARAVEIIAEDGTKKLVYEDELRYPATTPVSTEAAPTAAIDTQRIDPTGKELELYQKPGELVVQEKEVAKNWWGRTREKLTQLAGGAYWSAKWAVVQHEISETWDSYLNFGVKDLMSPEQRERQRKINRYAAIAAGTGLALILGSELGLQIGNAIANHAPSGAGGLGDHNDWLRHNGAHMHQGAGSHVETHGLPVQNAPGSGAEAAPVSPDAYSIKSGEGGLALFSDLHIDKSTWDAVAPSLPSRFPQDFEFHGTDIWIKHPGLLSTPAQNYFNSLRP